MRKDKINKKAWSILTEDERVAISLKLGWGKSTWQAGEVMNKAHYKFLEIEARAKHYIKMFTEHFELHDELIPDYIEIDPRVLKYLQITIKERTTIKEAVNEIKDKEFSIRTKRDELIMREMERLIKSPSAIDNNFALLIFDFDRWNNFRILPLQIQEPSAFKRRNKKNDQKNIKNLLSLNSYSIAQIIKRYKVKKHHRAKILYMPIPSKYDNKMGYGIIEVKYNEEIIQELSKVGFFLFYKEEDAQDFYDLVISYDFYNTKDCKQGQKFWPKYRQIIKDSINYNQIGKRIASRKFLESALRDLDINYLNPKDQDPNSPHRKSKKNKGLGLQE